MGALPRPTLPPGAGRELSDALHDLHHRAGWPSLRTLAAHAGCSHTTVSAAFSSPRLPSWGTLELLVEAMHGDTDHFHHLWLAASSPNGTSATTAVPRIAGRRDELAAVRRHLETGAGLLLVTGEAGMGKSRLVTVAADLTDTFVATGRCLPLSTEVPLLPVADALRAVHDDDHGQWVTDALADCPAYVAPTLARLLPELDVPRVPEPEDEWSRQRLHAAVDALLRALEAHRPLAVLVEDLHWADPATLDLLEHLVSRTPAIPLLGTWRLDDPVTGAEHQEWWTRIRLAPVAQVLQLGPLTRDETADQLSLLIGATPGAGLVSAIHARAAGHPLFIEQLASQDETEHLPELLADILDQRLAGVTPPAWLLARVLGVADRPLAPDLLARLCDLDPDPRDRALHELADHRLLADQATGGVQLRHPLLAEAVRRRLVGSEAPDLHRRLALALGEDESAQPAEVARHWQEAGDHDQEILWRTRAAQAAERRFAGRDAAEQWVRVLDLWPPRAATVEPGGLRRAGVFCAAIDDYALAGRDGQASLLAERAGCEIADFGPTETAELLRRLATTGDWFAESTLRHLDRAIELYRQLGPSEGLVDALGVKGERLVMQGRHSESGAALVEAVVVADQLPGTPLARVSLARLAYHEAALGRMDAAMQHIARATSMVPPDPDPVGDVRVALGHTDVLELACRPPEELEAAATWALDSADAWAVEIHERAFLLANVVASWIAVGQVSRAAGIIDPLTEGAFADHLDPLFIQRVLLDHLRDRRQAARDGLEALERGDSFPPARIGLTAELELAEGRPERALERVEDGLAGELRGLPGGNGGLLTLAAQAASDTAAAAAAPPRTALRRRLDALKDAQELDPFRPGAPPSDRLMAPKWNAELARLDGGDTVEAWVAAATALDEARPHHAAYCRWRAAQVALRAGQGTVAARLLARARKGAQEHVPLTAAIDETAGYARAREQRA